ncbi:PIN domain-containing protein [Sutcliffiella horikoshii]|uniref:PIN domain-containing protein n=1 Tax=Sutcliffiella horikoshii TaxID=79883 RepID=UPI00384DBCE5
MSLISTLNTPKAMLDTTVLCGALLTDGANRSLLRIARLGIYQPVISNVCLLEFLHNASKGLGKGSKKKVFDWNTIDTFLNFFVFPSLLGKEVTNSVVSRNSYEVIKLLTLKPHHSLGDAILQIMSLSEAQLKELIIEKDMQLPLEDYDINDFHVWSTAIENNCDYIITSNTKRFPKKVGPITRIHPIEFLRILES